MKIKNIFLTTVFATLSTVAIAADTAKPADDAHKGKSVKGETPEEVANKTKASLNKAGTKLGAKVDHFLKDAKKGTPAHKAEHKHTEATTSSSSSK